MYAPRTKVFANSIPSITATLTLNNSGVGSEGHFGALKTVGPGITIN